MVNYYKCICFCKGNITLEINTFMSMNKHIKHKSRKQSFALNKCINENTKSQYIFYKYTGNEEFEDLFRVCINKTITKRVSILMYYKIYNIIYTICICKIRQRECYRNLYFRSIHNLFGALKIILSFIVRLNIQFPVYIVMNYCLFL